MMNDDWRQQKHSFKKEHLQCLIFLFQNPPLLTM